MLMAEVRQADQTADLGMNDQPASPEKKHARGWADFPLRSKGLLVISVPLGFVALVILAFYLADRRSVDADRTVRHTLEVLNQVQLVHTRLEEAETGMRGYLLTGRKDWLTPFRETQESMPGILNRLVQQVSDNPALLARVKRIQELALTRLARMALWPSRLAAGIPNPDTNQVLLDSKQNLDALRQVLTQTRDNEEHLLQARLEQQKRARSANATVMLLAVILAPLSGLIAIWLFTSGVVRRIQLLDDDAHRLAQGLPVQTHGIGTDEIGRLEASLNEASQLLVEHESELRRSRDELESRVHERTAELAQTNQALKSEVAEKAQAEEDFRRARDTLDAIIQASPLAIVDLDLNGNVRSWNRAAEAIFGWRSEEVIGNPLPTIPKDAQADFLGLLENASHGQSLTGVERPRLRKDGTFIETRLWTAPLRDKDGNIAGKIAILADFTEHKRLEEQFIQAQKMEAIGRLAGGVAHDFNNLITVISGYGQMLLDGVQHDPSLSESAQEVLKAANRSAALAGQLLAFSRRQVIQPTILDPNELLRNFEKMLRRVIGEDVELKTVFAHDIGMVKADRGQIEQVIMNLAVNARDAMPGGGKLTIETANVQLDDYYAWTHAGLRAGQYVMLAVSDSGHGMDAETRRHLFEPFFTTKERGRGTGLGLSTVYGIVKQHGGDVWVYSEPGRGTIFKLYFPRAGNTADTEVATGVGLAPAGTETILVVEDEDGVRKLIKEILEHHGYRVIVAGQGAEALQVSRAHQGRIDLLLTDVIMPGMSGRELADQLSRELSGLKILFLSGYTDSVIVDFGVLSAGTAFLQKPFTPDVLARKVREVLDAARSA
jgi:PAS domain S-box-containing protein